LTLRDPEHASDGFMRIGLLGGTFDPVHNGHLRAALDVCERFGLDQCILVPSAVPPHKDGRRVAEVKDRLEMARIAAAGDSCLTVSDVEALRQGPSYTIDTVRHFLSMLSGSDELFLLLGIDAFLEIDTWYQWKTLLEVVAMIVMSRPDVGQSSQQAKLARFLLEHVDKGYRFDKSREGFFCKTRPPVYFLPVTKLEISSSDIRRRIGEGRSIRFLLPGAVERYIREKGLYR
jgi:nicotinate-nucleotide adenylyltransferase